MAGNPTRQQAAEKAKTKTTTSRAKATAKAKGETTPSATEKVAEAAKNAVQTVREKLNISPTLQQKNPEEVPKASPASVIYSAPVPAPQATTRLANNGTSSNQLAANGNTQSTGLSIPQIDLQSLIPTDLINPSIPGIDDATANNALAAFERGKNLQRVYQAGYSYLGEVAKTGIAFRKAEQGFIKYDIETVKSDTEKINLDIANNNRDIQIEKKLQSDETLKQEKMRTTHATQETDLLAIELEAQLDKLNADVERIRNNAAKIRQKFLSQGTTGI